MMYARPTLGISRQLGTLKPIHDSDFDSLVSETEEQGVESRDLHQRVWQCHVLLQ